MTTWQTKEDIEKEPWIGTQRERVVALLAELHAEADLVAALQTELNAAREDASSWERVATEQQDRAMRAEKQRDAVFENLDINSLNAALVRARNERDAALGNLALCREGDEQMEAAAREEQREADACFVETTQLLAHQVIAAAIRAEAADGTPQADRIAELEAESLTARQETGYEMERAFSAEARVAELESSLSGFDAISRAHEERDASRARVAELEASRDATIPGEGPYTADDVTAIEALRGKPYARLRATVTERDAALMAVAGRVLNACSNVAYDDNVCGTMNRIDDLDLAALVKGGGR